MKAPWTNYIEKRVAKALDAARPFIRAEVVQEIARGQQLLPMTPQEYPQKGGSPHPLYGYDRPLFWSVPASPRRQPDSIVDVDTIRKFADTYDVMRSCINHLKREVAAQPFAIVPRDSRDDSPALAGRIEEARRFFMKGGGLGEYHETRRHYEAKVLEDVLTIGCFASWKSFNRAGGLLQVLAIDAATIRPRYDSYGWPGPGEDYYEQWILGMLITGFKPDELTYDGLWPCSYLPWFKSPVEYLVATTLSALKSDEWNRSWLTDGNTPTDLLQAPPDWTPAQIREYADYFDEMLSGNARSRQKSKWVPAGSGRVASSGRKDQDFASFDLWLLRRCCAIYGVQPASIGFAGEQYKVSQETSTDSTTQFGAGSLLALRKEHYDDLLSCLGFGDLEVRESVHAEEAPLDRARRLSLACGGAWMSVNDGRRAEGLAPIEGGDVISGVAVGASEGLSSDEEELGRWMRKALHRFKEGRGLDFEFKSSVLPGAVCDLVRSRLRDVGSAEEIREAFRV